MKKIEMNIKEVQEQILEIMKEFDKICKEQNLTYYLSGGTMLGAVREKGFIAWDDDADIMLPRKDYMKFINLMMIENETKYELGSLYNKKGWTFPFSRLYDPKTEIEYSYINESKTGIYIDIFPMDGLPKSVVITKVYFLIIKFLWVCRHSAIKKHFSPDEKLKFIKKIIQKITPIIGVNKISKLIDKLARCFDYEKKEYVGVGVVCHYMENEHFKKKAFEKVLYQDFEEEKFPIPYGYDHYLSSLYGDYMKPPHIDKQASHHHLTVYVLED